jgi:branched-subunit amino acid transport protein
MTTWLVIVAVGAGSYVFRVLPIILDRGRASSPRFERAIAHAGTAALAALTVAGLRRGSPTAGDVPGLVCAAAAALAFAVRGASMVRVLLAGSIAYAVVLGGTALVT